MAAELIEHPKEIAEHIMLVDLARNDVGRVVEFGSVTRRRDDDARALQPRDAHDLAGVGPAAPTARRAIDVLRATLPAGTVSGAPKVRAMEIIDELEPTKRGPYAGVVGYLDFSGNIDTAIAIRTLVVGDDGRASVQAGRRHRRRQRARARGPRVPQQGPGPAGRHPGRPPDDGPPARPRRRTGDARWVAFAGMGDAGRPAQRPRARCPSSATSCCVDGPEAVDLPAGPAEPGRRGPRRRRRRRRRSCSSPPGRSTPGCASPGSATTTLAARRRRRATARPCSPGCSASSSAPRST